MSTSFYRPTRGFFEHLHPVTRILSLALAFVPPFLGRTPRELLPYLLLLIVTAAAAGAGPNLRQIRGVLFILFIMSTLLWTVLQRGATPLAHFGPVRVDRESLLYGISVGLRLDSFVLAAVIFLTCTRIEDFTYGLSCLGVPFAPAFALSLAFRLTPLFMESGQTILTAQRARGLDTESGGMIRRIRTHVPIIVPILAGGLRRSDQLAIAIESRGFGNRKQRSILTEFRVTWRDLVLPLALLAVSTAVLLFRSHQP